MTLWGLVVLAIGCAVIVARRNGHHCVSRGVRVLSGQREARRDCRLGRRRRGRPRLFAPVHRCRCTAARTAALGRHRTRQLRRSGCGLLDLEGAATDDRRPVLAVPIWRFDRLDAVLFVGRHQNGESPDPTEERILSERESILGVMEVADADRRGDCQARRQQRSLSERCLAGVGVLGERRRCGPDALATVPRLAGDDRAARHEKSGAWCCASRPRSRNRAECRGSFGCRSGG